MEMRLRLTKYDWDKSILQWPLFIPALTSLPHLTFAFHTDDWQDENPA